MGLVYIDGLEDTGGVIATNGTVSSGIAGRTGNGLRPSGTSGWFRLAIPPPWFDTVTVGFAWRASSINGANFLPCPLEFKADGGATAHCSLGVATGVVQIVRGSSTTPVLATSSGPPLTANRWYYIEAQLKLSDTVGFVKVNIDGVPVIDSGPVLDTRNAGTASVLDSLQFGMGISGTTIFDDLYIMSGDGDTFAGDCIVTTLLPNGNGAASSFVGSDTDSVDNYLLVDEVPPSGTDYVASATIGHQDLYTFTNVPASAGTIVAVAPTLFVAKDEVGPRLVKPLVRSTATAAGAAQSLDFSYAQRQAVFATNPDTGLAWTVDEVNAMQAGAEVA